MTRPPALLTAPADALTGLACLKALGAQLTTQQLITPLLISALIYAGGMVMNDVFDAELDAEERPEREIPSGRVSLKGAVLFGVGLQLTALALAFSVSAALLLIALALIFCTYLYNALLKPTLLGPLSMALCRALNLWVGAGVTLSLGALLSPNLSAWSAFTLPLTLSAATACYVLALTTLSRFEVHGGRGARFSAFALTLASLTPLALWAFAPQLSLGVGVALCLSLTARLAPPAWALLRERTPEREAQGARALVGVGVRGVALLNASWCAALGQWWAALALMGLSVSAGIVARRLATT
jgi:4-hydroxybenzoate polyprenyltransferase